MTENHFDIVISGGGMAGLSMALALADFPLSIALIEKGALHLQHVPEFDGRVSAIAYGSKIMLEKLGAWDAMAPYAEKITDIRVSDNESLFFLHYNFAEVGTEPFGWIVENRYIRKALYDAILLRKNITLLEQEQIESFKANAAHAEIQLESGKILNTKLAIAAEGKFSPLRMLAGIHNHRNSYKQTALVCTIQHSRPHEGLAQERFLKRGPFAVLPMTQDRSSLVWVEPEHLAPHYLQLAKEEIEQEITERVGAYLGDITLVGKLFSYPLELSVANAMTSERLALIGDAVHAIHPLAGQGINLGFRDVAVLHELISEKTRVGGDVGDAAILKAYERWRSLDTFSMAAVTDGLNRLFSNHSKLLRLARGLGLYGVSKATPLKQFFMKHAMGRTGDLPQLMRVV